MNYSLGTLLTQKNDEDFEQAINYLRRTLIGDESLYNPVEKESLWSSLSRRHDIIWSARSYMSFLELILCESS